MTEISPKLISIASKEFIDFLKKACTPFHAVAVVSDALKKAGYVELKEDVQWPEMKPCAKYFVTRNDSSIVAFSVGGKYTQDNGIKIVGAHTDSPNFALKPHTVSNKQEYQGVGVQCYGGGLWRTWFDRDLTVAGRVLIGGEKITSKIIKVDKTLMCIPNLAIHLCPADERDKFSPNKETHLVPIICTEVMRQLVDTDTTQIPNQCTPLFKALAEAAGCAPNEIIDFDLSVIDRNEASIGGVYDEFIHSARLDNLISCHCAIEALLKSDNTLKDDAMIRMVCLFDHEEIGSSSSQGAAGTLIPDIIERLVTPNGLRAKTVANSFLLSVDGAHGLHPNYKEKHESNHCPILQKGPVIKYNANVRYATNGYSAAVIKRLAEKVSIPIQEICVRNDSPCGSTIGPILSTLSGIKAVDIGNPMWSMHSIRETCGAVDIIYMTKLIKSFFENYTKEI